METQDFTDASGQRVDRLSAVKQVLDDFLSRRQGDRGGADLFWLSSLGAGAIHRRPRRLPDVIGGGAGAYGRAADGIRRCYWPGSHAVFERAEGVQDRVLIVLTDGNDTNSKVPPVRAAEIARAQKITIYTVAVGDPTAAGEEKLDEETLSRPWLRPRAGVIITPVTAPPWPIIYTQLDALPTRLSADPESPAQARPVSLAARSRAPYSASSTMPPGLYGTPGPGPLALAHQRQRPRRPSWLSGSRICQRLHFLRPLVAAGIAPGPAPRLGHRPAARRRAALASGLVGAAFAPAPAHRRRAAAPLQAPGTPAPSHLATEHAGLWLARPGTMSQRRWPEDTSALVLAVTVTPTMLMLAQDIQPSRLARAAQKIHDLLVQRPGTQTALVAYAGSAHLVLPLTRDASLIEGFVADLAPDIMPVEGDVAGLALALADQQLRKSRRCGSILLVGDSVAAEQVPLLTAHRQNGGAPVYILAVAADPGVPLPLDQSARSGPGPHCHRESRLCRWCLPDAG